MSANIETGVSMRLDLLRLQRLLPKYLTFLKSDSPAAIALAALPTHGLSLFP
jgi:hypothetical protein